MNELAKKNYGIWTKQELKDAALTQELAAIEGKEEEINDRFYRELEFGTGGLRGVLGVGTNRMNIYTVAKATRGYARYLLSKKKNPAVAIAYDSRINSRLFAETAAAVMADCGVQVYIWKELMPTPSLSFAVRYHGCDGGIVVTASHNPSKYNGYKVYGPDGCQMTNEAADATLASIAGVDMFADFSDYSFQKGLDEGKIHYIEDKVFDAFIDAVLGESLAGEDFDREARIVYTPLNGAGRRSVTEALSRRGFTNILLVKEQTEPDGNFPTCPYPNPEIREALQLGLETAKKEDADLLLASDPDCDRVGIAVKDGDDFKLLTGNEVGMLLLDYICRLRIEKNKMPRDPIFIKTIVTIDMASRIGEDYGVSVIDVLTGFKYIGEQIAALEAVGEENRYILGFEESYGYLTGTYVRDKDGVNAATMIAEMFAYYKKQNKSLLEVLSGLYEKYGYCLNTLYSFEFEGESGMKRMASIMDGLRREIPSSIGGKQVLEVQDYLTSETKLLTEDKTKEILLPKSNVLKLVLEDHISLVLRPSGTEPKLKLYISVSAPDREAAGKIEQALYNETKGLME